MGAVEPQIWTAREFKKASTPTNILKRNRGVELQLIDQTLDRHDALRAAGGMIAREAVVLQVARACHHWLVAKANKQSEYTTFRRDAVNRLGQQAFAWLQYRNFHFQKQLHGMMRQAGAAPALRAMGGGYAAERTMYVQGGKRAMPVSGSYIHEAMESQPHHQFQGRTFAQLTTADFQALDAIYQGEVDRPDPMADPGSLAKTKVPRLVLFLNKQERLKVLLLVQDGLLWAGFEQKFNTGKTFPQAFVMDEYANVYASTEIRPNGHSFNHSTFNAGKDVICAGTIATVQGQLVKIQNNSGHYRPTRQHLHNCCRLLYAAGVDFTQVKVIVGEPDPARPRKMIEHDYDYGAAFLADMNAAPSRSVPEP